LIQGKNLQGASDILSATPKLSADILSVEHNAIRARFPLNASIEPGRIGRPIKLAGDGKPPAFL
jgi:hypothetical protein